MIYAKSNTPEFGAGANTFNEVFGATRNPWDTSRSAAGSSGGAAVALATGMAWLAHGSDMGGSLRNPASFCGIVGMRPSIGRVAHTPAAAIDRNLGVQGPMARNVEDLALLLDAMSGEHPADPLSLPLLPNSFLSAARSGNKPKRIAYSPDLGITPVDPEVAAITRKAAQRFAEAGAIVEEAHPDLREAHECFHVLRAFDFAISKAALLRTKRDQLKPEVIWNIEEGLKLTVEQLERAEAQRVAMTARTLEFFETYDLLLTPATIVAPFPIENRYVAECAGKKFDNYVEWLGIVYAITLVCCPALSLPCGFTASGLPVGLQMVAPPRGEAQLARRRKGAGGYSGRARQRRRSIRGRRNKLYFASVLMVRSAATPRVSNHESPYVAHPSRRGEDAAPQDEVSARGLTPDRRAAPPAALIATDSASLVCWTMSSTSSSRLICAGLAGEQPLLGQHDHAMQRGPDFQGLPLAQKSDGGRFQRLQQQTRRFPSPPCAVRCLSPRRPWCATRTSAGRCRCGARPKASAACAKRDSFDCFDGLPIDSRRMALNWRKASAVTASSNASRSAKCR